HPREPLTGGRGWGRARAGAPPPYRGAVPPATRPGAVRTAAHRGLKRLAELIGGDPESAVALGAVPPQRESRTRAVTSAGVTHTRSRTQKDM
ncbi:hypothetical protein ACFW9X_02375, partial [Streptomyces sp. NPDC059466]